MRLFTYSRNEGRESDKALYGIGAEREGALVDLFRGPGGDGITPRDVVDCYDLDGHAWATILERYGSGGEQLDREGIRIEAPVPRPGKIVCVGLNYREHIEETGLPAPAAPLIFSKFPTCVVADGSVIRVPKGSDQLDYEAELAVIIGRRASGVSAEQAPGHVFGYTCFNDVSARDFQFTDQQWQRGKSCDTFAPMGPLAVTADEIVDPHALDIALRLNGRTLQNSNTRNLIFGVPELIEYISAYITLEPGDIIATGTPPGIGMAHDPPIFMQPGDVVEVEIAGLGTLTNPIAA